MAYHERLCLGGTQASYTWTACGLGHSEGVRNFADAIHDSYLVRQTNFGEAGDVDRLRDEPKHGVPSVSELIEGIACCVTGLAPDVAKSVQPDRMLLANAFELSDSSWGRIYLVPGRESRQC